MSTNVTIIFKRTKEFISNNKQRAFPEKYSLLKQSKYTDSIGIPGMLDPNRPQIHREDYQRYSPVDKDERTEEQNGVRCGEGRKKEEQ